MISLKKTLSLFSLSFFRVSMRRFSGEEFVERRKKKTVLSAGGDA
jgi:hypothetical protein